MSEQFGWSEWIEFKAGVPCPITWAEGGQYEVKWDDDDSLSFLPTSMAAVVFWRSAGDPFHYRYSLSAAPAGFVPPGAEKPWYPPQQPGFGPWVECNGNPPQVPNGTVVHALWEYEREDRSWEPIHEGRGFKFCDGDWPPCRVAYCVALNDQPTQEQVEATQKPETPEADASEDAKAANRPMCDDDVIGLMTGKWDRFNARATWQKPTAAPGFMVRPIRSSDGLLTVRGADHRLGLWE